MSRQSSIHDKNIESPTLVQLTKNPLHPLKRKGIQSVIIAGIVLLILIVLVGLSKFNEVRHNRLPFSWRSRLKQIVIDSATNANLANEVKDVRKSYHHLITAKTMLQMAQRLVGSGNLSSLTGMNIESLEQYINDNLLKVGKKMKITSSTLSITTSNTENPSLWLKENNVIEKKKQFVPFTSMEI